MILKVVLIIACVLVVLFLLSLLVFFFNLDMKMAAKLSDLLAPHYDKVKRDRMV